MKTLVEGQFGHGARRRNGIHRILRRSLRGKVAKSAIPFDWVKGCDVEDTIGAIKIKNQGQSDSCGGQAGAYYMEIQRALLKVPEEISAKSLYAPIAYPGGGTTVQALEQQLGTRGGALETEVPSYYATGEPLSEAMMIEKSWQTPPLMISELKRAGYAPLSVALDPDSIAEAIRDHGAVIIEIRAKNNGTWLSANPKIPSSSNSNPYWYHFMAWKGAKGNNFNAPQSWGTSVGDNGKQYFSTDWVTSKNILDAFVMVEDGSAVAVTPFWKQWILWFLRFGD